jgi:transcriptional regulator with XRE-family HTH domain
MKTKESRMPGQLEQIVERIKELREIAGISPESLAAGIGISADTYRSYESGAVDIPVGALSEVANFFKVELAELLTGEAPRLHKYCLVRKDRGVEVERRSAYRYQSLANNFIHKKAEPFLVTAQPAPADAKISLNSHPGQEFNFVLEGKLMLSIDGHELVMDEGDSIFFDSGAEHGMKALGGACARFLAIIL